MQRPASDPDCPGCWEMPGGSVRRDEESIFHGLAREIWSLTNMNISFVVRQIGKGSVFSSDYKLRDDTPAEENWVKVSFEVHVKEIQELSTYQSFASLESFHDFVDGIPVRISEAHQGWSWMTKEGVTLMLEGKVDQSFVDKKQGTVALAAFQARERQGVQSTGKGERASLGKRRKEVEEGVDGGR